MSLSLLPQKQTRADGISKILHITRGAKFTGCKVTLGGPTRIWVATYQLRLPLTPALGVTNDPAFRTTRLNDTSGAPTTTVPTEIITYYSERNKRPPAPGPQPKTTSSKICQKD
eukprot:2466547-Amphidinium_carterae.1